jgi:hypothetical protein
MEVEHDVVNLIVNQVLSVKLINVKHMEVEHDVVSLIV